MLAGIIASDGKTFRAVGTTNRVPTGGTTLAGSTFRLLTRRSYPIGGGNLKEARFLLPMQSFKVDATVGGYANDVRIIEAHALYDPFGTPISRPLKFKGSITATMKAGELDFLSDVITAKQFGLPFFEKGKTLRIHVVMEADAGGIIPTLEAGDENTAGQRYNPANTTVTGVGNPFPTVTGTAATGVHGFAAILLGKYIGDEPYTYLGLGDSIFANANNQSYFMRFMNLKAVGGIQCGRPGGNYPSGVSAFAQSLTKYCSAAIDEFGTNNIGNLAGIQTGATNLWTALKSNSLKGPALKPFKIIRTALLCSTTGTFTTPEGQTVVNQWGAGQNAENFNIWLASQVGTNIDQFADVSNTIRAAAVNTDPNFYKWAASMTTDGLHPNVQAATNLGTALANAITL